MLADEKKLQNIRVKRLGGAIYTVDEVSGLLGIPRPTLYRYLREYSIPHLRQAGRISIPEDSFDRIREARDLHKEGLGTESVRRQLREGRAPDTGDLNRRLDSLHSTLEDLRADIRERPAVGETALSPTMRTILARQSLLMSATFNLTEMVEDLLLASGKPRKPPLVDIGTADVMPQRRAQAFVEFPGQAALSTGTFPGADDVVGVGRTIEAGSADFGTLRRRRRRGVLAILALLLFAVVLALMIPTVLGGSGTSSAVPRVKATAGEPPANQKAVAAKDGSGAQQVPDVSDAAMLALLYVGGPRRTELASLKLSDYDPETKTMRIRGKGNKERQVFAEGGADLLLASWLKLRGEGDPSEPLFLPVRKDGEVRHTDAHGEKKVSLSDQAVYKMVKRRHREAKIKEVSPHDFRKTFVGDLLDAIGDLSTVQKLAGHSDPATTARYDRRGERAMREAASHLHVPHFGD